MILVILLIFVERIVLVDVLHVGSRLVGGVIILGLVVGIGRVSLRHVDALVPFEDGFLLLVVVRAAEIVVVIVGRVSPNGVKHGLIDLAPDGG